MQFCDSFEEVTQSVIYELSQCSSLELSTQRDVVACHKSIKILDVSNIPDETKRHACVNITVNKHFLKEIFSLSSNIHGESTAEGGRQDRRHLER